MRFVGPLFVLLALSSLAGCAGPTVVAGRDTAVRAEARRISSGTYPDVVRASMEPNEDGHSRF